MLPPALDLLLGGRCVGCARPGRVLCPGCTAALPTGGHPTRPEPTPPGLAPTWTAAPYDGLVRATVLAHKERRVLALAAPLGGVLAGAVAACLAGAPRGPVLLVPVPSRGASVRARGHDPTRAMTLRAAGRLRAGGSRRRPCRCSGCDRGSVTRRASASTSDGPTSRGRCAAPGACSPVRRPAGRARTWWSATTC